jgi:membrane-associated phospholipid phosphatase
MNEQLLDAINGFAGQSGLADGIAEFGARDGIYLLGLVAAGLGIAELRRDFRRGFVVGVAGAMAVMIALGLACAFGQVITEARPFVTDRDTVKLIAHGADNGFPSDHATVAAAVACAAALAWRRWTIIVAALAVFVGISRVFVGVHYPGDVAAGWALGAAGAGASWLAVRQFAPRVAVRA